ncbi:hypothetical protein [Natrinema ejinorense]|uniref:Uncharacterized protein n=1 Tax=Natrinema ejinorense TaxID=373386 RepID=A0A2A5QRC3_9EURY|nr:hypothetical protein [Natrinema ejinorense]PCR89303.1 hypothetical protein CP557_01380 [Natrinema ejinorense]
MTQPECIDDRLRKGDRVLVRLPIIDHPITYNEVHAGIIAGTIAFLIGERGVTLRTLLHEPWWALGIGTLAYVIGRKSDDQ